MTNIHNGLFLYKFICKYIHSIVYNNFVFPISFFEDNVSVIWINMKRRSSVPWARETVVQFARFVES